MFVHQRAQNAVKWVIIGVSATILLLKGAQGGQIKPDELGPLRNAGNSRVNHADEKCRQFTRRVTRETGKPQEGVGSGHQEAMVHDSSRAS